MRPVSLLFFSSDSIALPLLRQLAADSRFKVQAVICQPDKVAGRDQVLTAPPAKTCALDLGIPCHQPVLLKQATELMRCLAQDRPDFLLTFAYGQILNQEWLELPTIAPLNVHPSWLPRYRGPSPLQTALLNGDEETGLTLMKMALGMDSGPIAMQHAFPISPLLTSGELFEAMSVFAAQVIPEDILSLASNPVFKEQNEAEATYCKKLTKDAAQADFGLTAQALFNHYRAYTPWPGLWTLVNGKRLKILRVKVSEKSLTAGTVHVQGDRLWVGCLTGSLEVLELQMEGKKAMPSSAFIHGWPDLNDQVWPS